MNRVQLDYIDSAKDIGMTLRLLCTQRGESPRDVARAVGISHSNLSYIERGQYVPLFATIINLLNHYGYRLKAESVKYPKPEAPE
jgi:transcriptional regulator with XRE-family HTH domain